jgi:hypothetical protein
MLRKCDNLSVTLQAKHQTLVYGLDGQQGQQGPPILFTSPAEMSMQFCSVDEYMHMVYHPRDLHSMDKISNHMNHTRICEVFMGVQGSSLYRPYETSADLAWLSRSGPSHTILVVEPVASKGEPTGQGQQ